MKRISASIFSFCLYLSVLLLCIDSARSAPPRNLAYVRLAFGTRIFSGVQSEMLTVSERRWNFTGQVWRIGVQFSFQDLSPRCLCNKNYVTYNCSVASQNSQPCAASYVPARPDALQVSVQSRYGTGAVGYKNGFQLDTNSNLWNLRRDPVSHVYKNVNGQRVGPTSVRGDGQWVISLQNSNYDDHSASVGRWSNVLVTIFFDSTVKPNS
mmetsp:Transcript_4069/g.6293  ORF Transcript_4069/g.6293 Transcript_4069/m.6293 type:complete len:210 (-) Transcript_4069:1362-1991(-)